ncbi:Hypothetical predicted protein, partial [Xyrichtys novacula]
MALKKKDTLCDAVTDDQGGGGKQRQGLHGSCTWGRAGGRAARTRWCGDGLPFRSGAAVAGPAEFCRTASRRNLLRAAEDAVWLSERWSRRVPGHCPQPGTDGEGSPPPVPGHTGIPPHTGREVFYTLAP